MLGSTDAYWAGFDGYWWTASSLLRLPPNSTISLSLALNYERYAFCANMRRPAPMPALLSFTSPRVDATSTLAPLWLYSPWKTIPWPDCTSPPHPIDAPGV